MQHLVPITVRRLRIAAARLRTQRRRDALDRAIWIAARNQRQQALADPDSATEALKLPAQMVERIDQLAPIKEFPDAIDDDSLA